MGALRKTSWIWFEGYNRDQERGKVRTIVSVDGGVKNGNSDYCTLEIKRRFLWICDECYTAQPTNEKTYTTEIDARVSKGSQFAKVDTFRNVQSVIIAQSGYGEERRIDFYEDIHPSLLAELVSLLNEYNKVCTTEGT